MGYQGAAVSIWGERDEGGRFWRLAAPSRDYDAPSDMVERVQALGNNTVEHIPLVLRTRFALAWAECLEGMATGDEGWSTLARCRARLLCSWIDQKEKTSEMRKRLQLWEQGKMRELLERVERAQNLMSGKWEGTSLTMVGPKERRQGKRAKKCTVKGRYRKAMMAFSSKGRIEASAADKIEWADTLIPRSERPHTCGAGEQEITELLANHVHGGSDAAMYKHLAVKREEGQIPIIPVPTFPALCRHG